MITENKTIDSTITADCGVFKKIPGNFKAKDGVLVNFYQIKEKSKIKNDSLKVVLVFDKTNYSKEEAQKVGQDLIKDVALSFAIFNKLNFTWRYNISSRWKNSGDKMFQITTSFTMRSRIAGIVDCAVPNNFEIANQLLKAFEFFNNALYNKENNREKEVAFWLYFAIEVLAFDCNKNKKAFENEIVKNKIITRKKINDLNYSLGSYYRHHKSSGNSKVLKIEECVELVREIIYFYNDKLK